MLTLPPENFNYVMDLLLPEAAIKLWTNATWRMKRCILNSIHAERMASVYSLTKESIYKENSCGVYRSSRFHKNAISGDCGSDEGESTKKFLY